MRFLLIFYLSIIILYTWYIFSNQFWESTYIILKSNDFFHLGVYPGIAFISYFTYHKWYVELFFIGMMCTNR